MITTRYKKLFMRSFLRMNNFKCLSLLTNYHLDGRTSKTFSGTRPNNSPTIALRRNSQNYNGNKAKNTSCNKNWNPEKVKCGKPCHLARKCRNKPIDRPPQANMIDESFVAMLSDVTMVGGTDGWWVKLRKKRGEGDFESKNSWESSKSLRRETRIEIVLETLKICESLSWKSRLSERFSPERERITWEGEILGYTERFSPERELPRLGEKWQTGAVDIVRFSLERESLA
ncbi:hypothetical protein Lal_00016983 [Lupinus albus]|nr:hypothetical protein Lal_00016983 [Lupinus albus]